jgi:DNA (cytosine-5)-methyltransferase 1
MLNGLDLFSGIGGLSLALKEWVRPVAYCEIDPYCQAVLMSNMVREKLIKAPIWDDIRTMSRSSLPREIDIIYGGFPCQDISIAGHGKGLEGERSGLFFEILRLAKEIKPKFLFLENVPAITSRGGLRVVREIASLGYDCRWCVISAASVGALHKRERWFLLAHSNSSRLEEQRNGTVGNGKKQPRFTDSYSNVSHSRCNHEGSEEESKWASKDSTRCSGFWEIEPSVGRLANGISNRVDRLRALGNAVVPLQAREAFKILMGLK